jgi:hypothetical protein
MMQSRLAACRVGLAVCSRLIQNVNALCGLLAIYHGRRANSKKVKVSPSMGHFIHVS